MLLIWENFSLKHWGQLINLRKKFSEFVSTDRSFRESVMMVCHFIHAKLIFFGRYQRLEYSVITFCQCTEYLIILWWGSLLLICCCDKNCTEFWASKESKAYYSTSSYKVVCLITCWNLHKSSNHFDIYLILLKCEFVPYPQWYGSP
jgi:hypothetical protein